MRTHNDRGSVTVLVIAVLATLMLIGVVFIMSAWADRKNTAALTTAAPLRPVAQDAVHRLQERLAADLYLGDDGPFSVPGMPGAVPTPQNVRDLWLTRIDTGIEDADRWVASTEGQPVAGTDALGRQRVLWRHLSNLSGATGSQYVDQQSWEGELVDTDGDRIPDARLEPSGAFDPSGRQLYYAVRVVDLNGYLNVNVAYWQNPAFFGNGFSNETTPSLMDLRTYFDRVMPGYDLNDGMTLANFIHALRCGGVTVPPVQFDREMALRLPRPDRVSNAVPYRPFGVGDEISMRWLGAGPDAMGGPLYAYLEATAPFTFTKAQYDRFRSNLTSYNVDRYLRRYAAINAASGDVREATLENLSPGEIYEWIFSIYEVARQIVPPNQDALAAQFAVNLFALYQPLADPATGFSPPSPGPSTIVFWGHRPDVAITEGYVYAEAVPDPVDPMVTHIYRCYAVELYNPLPYVVELGTRGYKLGGEPLTGSIQPYERLVFYTADPELSGLPADLPGNAIELPGAIDLSGRVLLEREGVVRTDAGAQPQDMPVDLAPSVTAAPVAGTTETRTRQRCDEGAYGLQWAAIYDDDNAPTLGDPNTAATPDSLAPAQRFALPMYRPVSSGRVRDVGDLIWVYLAGATSEGITSRTFSESILDFPDNPSRGRPEAFPVSLPLGPPAPTHQPIPVDSWVGRAGADPGDPTQTYPDVPWAALLLEVYRVLNGHEVYGNGGVRNPDHEQYWGNLYGRVNLNTATRETLMSLPLLIPNPPLMSNEEPIIPRLTPAPRQLYLEDRDGQRRLLAEFILAYREHRAVRDVDDADYTDDGPLFDWWSNGSSNPVTYGNRGAPGLGIPNLRHLSTDDGYLSAYEVAVPMAHWYNYLVTGNMLGLDPTNPSRAMVGTVVENTHPTGRWLSSVQRDSYFTRISNLISVRSDTFVAYVRVQVGNGHDNPGSHERPQSVRHYIAIIDRSNCRQAGELPLVRAFAEIK